MLPDLIGPLLQCLLTLVLAVAGAAKLFRPVGFRETLTALGVPQHWSLPAAVLVPSLELLVATLLWVPHVRFAAAVTAALLFASFAALGMSFRSRQIRCNCFGPLIDDTLGVGTMARNIPLCAAALTLVVVPVSSGDFRPADWSAWVLTTVGLFLMEPLARRVWR